MYVCGYIYYISPLCSSILYRSGCSLAQPDPTYGRRSGYVRLVRVLSQHYITPCNSNLHPLYYLFQVVAESKHTYASACALISLYFILDAQKWFGTQNDLIILLLCISVRQDKEITINYWIIINTSTCISPCSHNNLHRELNYYSLQLY